MQSVSISGKWLRKNKKLISKDIKQKGLQSLDNPVLKGSYILILTQQQMNILYEIDRNAFRDIIDHRLFELSVGTKV